MEVGFQGALALGAAPLASAGVLVTGTPALYAWVELSDGLTMAWGDGERNHTQGSTDDMPFMDARALPGPAVPNKSKRKLGSRDEPAVDPAAVLAELVSELVRGVARVLQVGGSIQFGSTRDRKAILIRAWVAGDVYEDYVKTVAELVATLEVLDDVCEGAEHRDPTPLNGRAVRGS